jgi:hypothetical protein
MQKDSSLKRQHAGHRTEKRGFARTVASLDPVDARRNFQFRNFKGKVSVVRFSEVLNPEHRDERKAKVKIQKSKGLLVFHNRDLGNRFYF